MSLEKREFPFQLVVHLDKDGFRRVEGNSKIEYYDGDVLKFSEIGPTRSLAKLKEEFPFGEFLSPVEEAALLTAEEKPQLESDLAQARAEVTALREALALREQFIANFTLEVVRLGEAATNTIRAIVPKE